MSLPLFSVHAAYGHLFITHGAPFYEIAAMKQSNSADALAVDISSDFGILKIYVEQHLS